MGDLCAFADKFSGSNLGSWAGFQDFPARKTTLTRTCRISHRNQFKAFMGTSDEASSNDTAATSYSTNLLTSSGLTHSSVGGGKELEEPS